MKKVLALVVLISAGACSQGSASSTTAAESAAESDSTATAHTSTDPYASAVTTGLPTAEMTDFAAAPLYKALAAATAALEVNLDGSPVPLGAVTNAVRAVSAAALQNDGLRVGFECSPADLVATVPQLKLEVASRILVMAAYNRAALDSTAEVERGLLSARLKDDGIKESGRSLAELRDDARADLNAMPDNPDDANKESAVYLGLLTQAWETKEFGPLAPAQGQALRKKIYHERLGELHATVTLDGAAVDLASLPFPPGPLDLDQIEADCGGPTSISSQTSAA